MVGIRKSKPQYITASESELDVMLRGERVVSERGGDFRESQPLRVGETGIFIGPGTSVDLAMRPLALVVNEEDIARLCGRYAQLRADLSPLTSWCHLLTPATLRSLKGIAHEPYLQGTDASWSGLAVAEAVLLSGMPAAGIRISACLASATYAIARTKALWREIPIEAAIERFEFANQLCRGRRAAERARARAAHVRASLWPMWHCLSALVDGSTAPERERLQPLVDALVILRDARVRRDPKEAIAFVDPLLRIVPEAQAFERLSEIPAEERLGLFDRLTGALRGVGRDDTLRRHALALSAGYLATVAAGGSASLGLVEANARRFPELTAWAYLIGGIGENVTWTSGFDGLGRLVARELQRRLYLDEPPTCDFAFDEARVLWDGELKEPLVHLRIKQARVITVALFPGVNVSIPIVAAESRWGASSERRASRLVPDNMPMSLSRSEALDILVRELWPLLRPLVIDATRAVPIESEDRKSRQRGQKKVKGRKPSQLPLKDSEGSA